jgi:hypothetical protein
MKVQELVHDLGLSRQTIVRLLKTGRVPGGERLYTTDKGRERWVVDRAIYERWRALQQDLRA